MINLKPLPICKDKTVKDSMKCYLQYINNFIKRDFFFYNISLNKLSKYFLNDFLNLDVFTSKEKDIYTQYESTFQDTKYPKEEDLFYKYILINYLNIYSSPYNNFISLLKKSQTFLNKIINEIKTLETKIKDYDKKNILTVEDRYHKKHLKYYLEKNSKIKENIIKFISTDIYYKAYTKCQDNNNSDLLADKLGIQNLLSVASPIDEFYKFEPQYIENFNEFIYKFGFLPVDSTKKLMDLHKNNNKEFMNIIKELVENIIQEINDLIATNHILFGRKEILKTIFNHFNKNDYISINNMLPLQIEGLFYDFCILLGISAKSIEISSLNDKLDKIADKSKDKNLFFWSYEYFTFKFPIIRNKVSHGRIFEASNELQAYYLLLDLYNVINLIIDDKIKLNKYIQFLNDKITDEKILKLYNFKNLEVPNFYKIEKIINEITIRLKSNEFNNFLFDKIKTVDLDNIDNLKNQIIYLKDEYQNNDFAELIKKLELKRKDLKEEKKVRDIKFKKFIDRFNKNAIS